MLEAILFRRQATALDAVPIDLGLLCEAMIFYGSVEVIADRDVLAYLLARFGANALIELCSEGFIDLQFCDQLTGISSISGSRGIECHSPIIASSPQHTFDIQLRKICITHAGADGKGRRLARRLERDIDPVSIDVSVTASARAAILNDDYLRKAVIHVIKSIVPDISFEKMVFLARASPDGIEIESNIDYRKLNTFYHKIFPREHSEMSNASILGHILAAESDIFFSSRGRSEIATNPIYAGIMSDRITSILRPTKTGEKAIAQFQEILFPDCLSIKESVNSGLLPLRDLVEVVKRSRRFRQWASEIPFDANLLSEYIKELSAEPALSRFPAKLLKWSLFSLIGGTIGTMVSGPGLGTIAGASMGTIAEQAVSAFEALVLEGLIQGWRPHQFVEQQLKPILIRGTV